MAGTRSPWGDAPPRKPRPGSGRAALTKRATARGGRERRAATAAARRALDRGVGNRRSRSRSRSLPRPVRGAWNELVRHSRSVQQRFLVRQRLRPVLLALAATWIVWTFLLGEANLLRFWSVRRENARLDASIVQMEAREVSLRKDVRALRSGDEPELIERLAREEHAMVRDGERLVRFVLPEE